MMDYLEKAFQPLLDISGVGQAHTASATRHPLPDNSCDALVTDPPYYDAVPYSDLSDYFYVWLKRSLPPSLQFTSLLTPKDEECIVDDAKGKDDCFFEAAIGASLAESRRILHPGGIGVVVFAAQVHCRLGDDVVRVNPRRMDRDRLMADRHGAANATSRSRVRRIGFVRPSCLSPARKSRCFRAGGPRG